MAKKIAYKTVNTGIFRENSTRRFTRPIPRQFSTRVCVYLFSKDITFSGVAKKLLIQFIEKSMRKARKQGFLEKIFLGGLRDLFREKSAHEFVYTYFFRI